MECQKTLCTVPRPAGVGLRQGACAGAGARLAALALDHGLPVVRARAAQAVHHTAVVAAGRGRRRGAALALGAAPRRRRSAAAAAPAAVRRVGGRQRGRALAAAARAAVHAVAPLVVDACHPSHAQQVAGSGARALLHSMLCGTLLIYLDSQKWYVAVMRRLPCATRSAHEQPPDSMKRAHQCAGTHAPLGSRMRCVRVRWRQAQPRDCSSRARWAGKVRTAPGRCR